MKDDHQMEKSRMVDSKKKRLIQILFVIYIICVLRITVFRSGMGFHNLFEGTINASLFQSYIPLFREGNRLRIIYLFGGNIVWFIPFGMYLQWLGKWNLKIVVAIGFLFSLLIETMQYILGTGISELDDLVLNTFGTAAGAGITICFNKFFSRRKYAKKDE